MKYAGPLTHRLYAPLLTKYFVLDQRKQGKSVDILLAEDGG